MKSTSVRLLLAVAFTGAALAITTPVHAGPVLPEVGPTPPGMHDRVSTGTLQVFSRTEQTQWGEGSYYNVHTAYWIYDTSGHRIKTVSNHSDQTDETPEKVALAPGRYVVKAWSERDGLVAVPVIIKLAQTTRVRLDGGDVSEQASLNPDRAVKSPSGQIVGWKA